MTARTTFPAPPEPSMREVLTASYRAAFKQLATTNENLKLTQASYAGLLLHLCEGDVLEALAHVVGEKREWFKEVVRYLDGVHAEERWKR